MMKIDILTPFPILFNGIFQDSILKRAQEKKRVCVKIWDLRSFTDDRHQTVDDYPYGGGAGMVLKPEPIFKAIDQIKKENHCNELKIILMTPQGKTYTQKEAQTLSKEKHLVFVCGHYRGVDERIVEALVTEEISIGDYILTGGELPAAVVIDSVIRLLPGVLGDFDSAKGDSFHCGLLDHPHYTRPAEYQGMRVPEILLSGHHARIASWRNDQMIERTRTRRPDLIQKIKKEKNK